ncbi:hypothetical protein AWQ23_15545 (plasmid) [Picosynechococcus sp. PCC 73109]|nr:hypothetical protein AWQ23_15545 [Picosynechococcus sp. PCC 73109]
MALSQPTPPRSGLLTRDLIEAILAGFRVMSSLGVFSLIKPLELILGRPAGRPNRDRQISLVPEIPMQVKENLPPLPPAKIILDGSLDHNE